jgi:hypothetical protein
VSELTRVVCVPEAALQMQTATAEIDAGGESPGGRDRMVRNGHVSWRDSRRSRRNEWSSEELRRLRELAATGTPLNAIAAALRRTASSVRNKAGMQGISLRLRR